MPARLKLPADFLRVSSAKFLSYAAYAANVAVILVGSLVLAGGALDISAFQSGFSGSVMNANIALAFILSGVSLWLYRSEHPQKPHIWVAGLCALVVAFFALLTLIDYLLNWNLGLDQLLISDSAGATDSSATGHMSPITALNFLLIGTALLLLYSGHRRTYHLGESFILTAGLISLLALIGYAYNFRSLYEVGYTTVAFPTAAAFLLLSVGILCARPDHGLMAVVTSQHTGGFLARRILPAALIVPLCVGWAGLKGQEAGWYDTAVSLALVVSLVVVILLAIIWRTALLLDRMDIRRIPAEDARLQLVTIVESTSDAIIGKSLDGLVLSWNKSAERIFGYTVDEIIEKPVTVLIPPGRLDEEPEIIARLTQGLRIDLLETVRRRKDGQDINVSLTISPIRDSTGRIIGISEIARDITGRKQAEAVISRLNDELEQRVIARTADLEAANKELEAFSYSVSHDLRAPLRAMDGFSRILMEEHASELSGEAMRFLQLVRTNTRQMGYLIDDLLTFSRLSRQPLTKRFVSPADVVDQCVKELRAEEEGRRVEVTVGELPLCRADARLLKQVWFNLLANAFKYTRNRQPAEIDVGSYADKATPGGSVYFIKDNGVGFDMQYADKLFGVFQRMHRAEDYDGTGVGLAIVQRIIQRHGGQIWADSKVNHGTTFFFTLKGEHVHEHI